MISADVRNDQWSAPTGCPDWSVRELVNHLVGGNLAFAAILSDQTPPDRAADHLGNNPLAAYQQAGRTLQAAFAQPGVFDKLITVLAGTLPGIAALHVRITEALVHGWDLAHATGQSAAVLPADLAETEHAATRTQLVGAPRTRAPLRPRPTRPRPRPAHRPPRSLPRPPGHPPREGLHPMSNPRRWTQLPPPLVPRWATAPTCSPTLDRGADLEWCLTSASFTRCTHPYRWGT